MKAPANNAKPSAANVACPLAKLKDIWLKLPEAERNYWREQLSSRRPMSELRSEILAKFNIKLSGEGKVSLFRTWILDRDILRKEVEQQLEDQQNLESQHPDWSMDKIHDEVLRRFYFRIMATENYDLFFKVIAGETRSRRIDLGEFKINQATAREFCLKEAKEFPAVMELFRQAFAALEAAKSLQATK